MSYSAHKSIALAFLIIIIGGCFSPIAFVPKLALAQAESAGKLVAGAPAVAAACASTAAAQLAPTTVTTLESISVAATLGVLVALPPTLSGFLGGNSGSNIQNNQKQSCLNAIAWYLAKILIDQIVQSTIAWINSGFQGSPTFVSNPGQFFKNVVDENFVEFMNALFPQTQGLTDLLCSPFKLDLQFKLLFKFNFNSRTRDIVKCRISDIAQNIDGFGKSFEDSVNDFYSGNFSEGGWNRWLEITQVPSNNPIGLELVTEEALSIKIASALGEQKAILDWGSGFHSITNKLGEGIQTIVTPGATIENALAEVTTEDIRQLGLADEFNEIVGALLSQLMKTAFSAGGGVSGLSKSSGGGRSYLDKLQKSSNPQDLLLAATSSVGLDAIYETGQSSTTTNLPKPIGSSIPNFGGPSTADDEETQQMITLPAGQNIALGRGSFTTQGLGYINPVGDRLYPAATAVDSQFAQKVSIDVIKPGSGFHQPAAAVSIYDKTNGTTAWWEIDLGKEEYIEKIKIYPIRRDLGKADDRTKATNFFTVNIYDSSRRVVYSTTYENIGRTPLPESIDINVPTSTKARYLRIQRYDTENKDGRLELSEVQVIRGATPPAPTATSTTP